MVIQRKGIAITIAVAVGVAALAAFAAVSRADTTTRSTGGKPVTLTVWDFGYFPDDFGPGLKQIDRRFEQLNPQIKVNHVGIPYSNAFEKIRAAIAAHQGPDLVSMYPGAFAASYRQGLLPLDSRLTSAQKQQLLMLDISKSPDGSTYALPFTAYGFVFFYNKKEFAKAHIAKAPQTWNDLLGACSKLSAAGIAPIASGWKDGYSADWYYYVFADQLLGKSDFAKLVAGKLPLDNPKLVQALGTLTALQKAGCFEQGGAGRTVSDAEDQFKTGKAAIELEVDAQLKLYQSAMGKSVVGAFQPPVAPGSQYKQMLDVGPNHGYAITRFSKNPDAAFKYLSFLVSRPGQKIIYDVRGSLPSTKGVPTPSNDPVRRQIISWVARPGNRTVYLALPASVTGPLEHNAAALVAGTTSADSIAKQMEQLMQQVRAQIGAH